MGARKDMETIKFECEIITPMFLGGADGKSAELRAPSIKGALRFWWRAMNGHLPLKELHEKEAEIFGGSGGDNGRRSQVVVRVESGNIKINNTPFTGKIADNPTWYRTDIRAGILRYLTLGTFKMGEGMDNRDYIEPGSKFTVKLSFLSEKYADEVKRSFYLLSLYGGVGSKSRNGFGSFLILNKDISYDYTQLVMTRSSAFSAFSTKTKSFKTIKGFNKWNEALEEIGNVYRITRLQTDEGKYIYKNRVYLTQPILKAEKFAVLDRHSKPFFISIRKEKNLFFGYLLFLDSYYMKNSEIKFLQPELNMEKANINFNNATSKFLSILKSDSRVK